MGTARAVFFVGVGLLVAAETKIGAIVTGDVASSDQTPREIRLNIDRAESIPERPPPPPVPTAAGEDRAATFLQPQFVVPDNGDPVGLRVRPGGSGGDPVPPQTASRRADGPGTSPPPAADRADSYGLLSGPELAGRHAEVGYSPDGTPLSAGVQRRVGGPPLVGGRTDTRGRGRLLSLIDGVYQRALDTDANTTFITPLDRLGRVPFALSVSRYSRFVEDQAKLHGQQQSEEDLEDLLQRLKGRLDIEEQDDVQAEELEGHGKPTEDRSAEMLAIAQETNQGLDDYIAFGGAVDPGLTERSILSDTQTGGGTDDTELANGQVGHSHDIKVEKRLADKPPNRNPEASPEDYHVHAGYEHKPESVHEHNTEGAESTKGINRIIFGQLENQEITKGNDSAKYEQENHHHSSHSSQHTHHTHPSSSKGNNEKALQGSRQQTVSKPASLEYIPISDDKKACQHGCKPIGKGPALSDFDEKRNQDAHSYNAEKEEPRESFDIVEISDTLQPPLDPDSYSDPVSKPEDQNATASSLSTNDYTEKYDDAASELLLDDGNNHSKIISSPSSSGVNTSRHLAEYETHAEISLRDSLEPLDPEAEGYGPAKPSSIYIPGEDSESKNVTSSEENEADKQPEGGVIPRSLDTVETPAPSPSSKGSSKRAEPRLIEPWDPPKQRPRIKIHLPFVQKETVVQFHPPDRHKYGPPKGIYSESVKPATLSNHPPRHKSASVTVEHSRPSKPRSPSRTPTDGHVAAGSSLPNHHLPKEHRAKGHGHRQPRPQHGKRTNQEVSYQLPEHPGLQSSYKPPKHKGPGKIVQPDPFTGYRPLTPRHPKENHGTPAYQTPPKRDPKPHHGPSSLPPKSALRPAWLDVPHEVLPLAAPPGIPTVLPYDATTTPGRLTPPEPDYLTPKPVHRPAQPHEGTPPRSKGVGKPSSFAQSGHSPAFPVPTQSSAVHSYVSPIPVRLRSTTPSSYVSLQSNPSHVSPRPTSPYVPPKSTPSYTPPKPSPSYTPPKPHPSYTPSKVVHVPASPQPTPTYISPRPSPSHPHPKPTPAYAPPNPSPSHSAPVHPSLESHLLRPPHNEVNHPFPGHPIPGPPVVLPPPAVRNYVVLAVNKLAKRPQARAPTGSLAQGHVALPHGDLPHISVPTDVYLPPPEQAQHPVRNYVASPEDKLVQKPLTPVHHAPGPALVGQAIRNYVPPPEHELAQNPHFPDVHPTHPVPAGQSVRNYAASSESLTVRRPQPVLVLPSNQTPIGRITRNYRPPPLRGDDAERHTVQQDTREPHIVVGTLQRSDDDNRNDGAQLNSSVPPTKPGQQLVNGGSHGLQQQKQEEQQQKQQKQQQQKEQKQQQQKQQQEQKQQEKQKKPQEQQHKQEQRQELQQKPNQQQQQYHSHDTFQKVPEASSPDGRQPQRSQKASIIDVLKAADSKLLLKLMEISGMRQLLKETGPYTLFAPKEQALQDLLHRLGGLDTIVDSMGKESLLKLLQYHVLRGYALEEDLDHDLLAKTLEGARLRINRYDTYDNVYGRANVTTVNGERVVRADLVADNGLVHFIDGVLAPPPADLMQALRRDPRGRFTVLTEALKLAGLQSVLTERTDGPLTLLAPTNVAFTQLPADQLRRLLHDRRRLRQLLLGHVLSGTLYSAGLQPFQERQTLAGSTVRVFSDTVSVKVDNALVLVPDVTAGNGVVHAIDAVLGLPEER